MLRFRRIEIEQFAVFEKLVIRPSVCPDRPLTVIRAENGSGKTTFLRALLWGMYGERGLPGGASRYSVHPAWWTPDDDGIETMVAIEFETDGSSRHDPDKERRANAYRLSRSVRTVGRKTESDDEPDFRRMNERTLLMQRSAGGEWMPHDAGPDAVVRQLLPLELRDFFVMDADKAADYVGGTESKMLDRSEVEALTSAAVRSLLGIEVFEQAAVRLSRHAKELGKEATKASGDRELAELQARKDGLEVDRDRLLETIEKEGERRRSLQSQLADNREKRNAELIHVGAHESLVQLEQAAEARLEDARNRRDEQLTGLANSLEDRDLLAPLMASTLREVVGGLEPDYDAGAIPLRHIAFVRRLLDEGICVCGEDLAGDARRGSRVREQLDRARAKEDEATFLGELYEAADGLIAATEGADWVNRQRSREGRLAEAEGDRDAAAQELRDVKRKIDEVDRDKVRVLRDEEAALEDQVGQIDRSTGRHSQELAEVTKDLESVTKTLTTRQRQAAVGRESLKAQMVAELGADILRRAYETVQERQVEELSNRMNRLFGRMAASFAEEEPDHLEDARESARMIGRVGIRPVGGQRDRFEIFALNHRGRAMPPTEINGASRRVLALSFILALCAESRTHAPLVADSLLNSMSGAVRRNTLEVTVRNSEQPILLLTGSDLESDAEAEIVRRYGGALYTLTAQWHATEGGGDVVRRAGRDKVALLCACGPRQYCRVCERVGQAEAPGWSRRGERNREEGPA